MISEHLIRVIALLATTAEKMADDYERLAFPEDDKPTDKYRRKILADVRSAIVKAKGPT